MKNVTVTLPEEIARWARVWAARHDTSLSRMLGEMVRQRMNEEDSYEAARKSFLKRRPRKLKIRGRYPRREAIHDRALLR